MTATILKSLSTAAVLHTAMVLSLRNSGVLPLTYFVYPLTACFALLRKHIRKERGGYTEFIPFDIVKVLLCLIPSVYSPINGAALAADFYIAIISCAHIVVHRYDEYFKNARERLIFPETAGKTFRFIPEDIFGDENIYD